MKPVVLVAVLILAQLSFLSADNYVKRIEKLRSKNQLTKKVYPDKTVVGSLAGYYKKDSLVLLNSLTDGEASGLETLYYIQNGALQKVYLAAAQLKSYEGWHQYASRHNAADNCYTCHGEANCIATVITFEGDTTITVRKNGKLIKLTSDERAKILRDVIATSKELKVILQEL